MSELAAPRCAMRRLYDSTRPPSLRGMTRAAACPGPPVSFALGVRRAARTARTVHTALNVRTARSGGSAPAATSGGAS